MNKKINIPFFLVGFLGTILIAVAVYTAMTVGVVSKTTTTVTSTYNGSIPAGREPVVMARLHGDELSEALGSYGSYEDIKLLVETLLKDKMYLERGQGHLLKIAATAAFDNNSSITDLEKEELWRKIDGVVIDEEEVSLIGTVILDHLESLDGPPREKLLDLFMVEQAKGVRFSAKEGHKIFVALFDGYPWQPTGGYDADPEMSDKIFNVLVNMTDQE